MILAYDGTGYHGWQRQHNGITIQEVLEDCLSEVFNKKIIVTGCSRTDAGVHAKMYVCNFSGTTTIPTDKIPFVMNTILPPDIRVYDCTIADDDFNARFHTVSKTYEYTIVNRPFADPLLRNFAWHYPVKLDVENMKQAASIICGKHDFASFCAAGSSAKTTVRNLYKLSVNVENNIITIKASADGFLYNMVRIIVGTLVYVGNGKLTVADIYDFMEKKDRRLMGITAPPQGLSLVEVNYEQG